MIAATGTAIEEIATCGLIPLILTENAVAKTVPVVASIFRSTTESTNT